MQMILYFANCLLTRPALEKHRECRGLSSLSKTLFSSGLMEKGECLYCAHKQLLQLGSLLISFKIQPSSILFIIFQTLL